MQRLAFALLLCLGLWNFSARAQEADHAGFKPDDKVMFDLAAEDWVTTKTAHVAVTVEAAVSASTEGTMRADMMKAVNSLAKSDWRLTSFDRSQDQTGMERWSAVFETRLPETELGGLNETAKKLSKAGMQVSVSAIDFTPTLAEMEAARGNLRTQIYKMASDQLATLNGALPGRNYRIALVDFTGDDGEASPMPRVMKGRVGTAMMAMQAPEAAPPPVPVERAQKITLTARIVYAASAKAAPSLPAPEPKR